MARQLKLSRKATTYTFRAKPQLRHEFRIRNLVAFRFTIRLEVIISNKLPNEVWYISRYQHKYGVRVRVRSGIRLPLVLVCWTSTLILHLFPSSSSSPAFWNLEYYRLARPFLLYSIHTSNLELLYIRPPHCNRSNIKPQRVPVWCQEFPPLHQAQWR